MSVAGAIAATIALIVLGVTLFLIGVQMIVWNSTDIYFNGANFWNVFWLSIVGVAWFGAGGRAVK